MLCSSASQECIWLRRLLNDFELLKPVPTTIYEDNQGAIQLCKNPKFHNRTKHIDISYHFIREQVNKNAICVKYCPTESMIADIMTKPLSKPTYERFRDLLGVKQI